mmetsp:Transcript_7915/g.19643  ORF Transcript_7915/g.19643 Transcript_7915/m.19643 type:complete len:292 (-) Transcript_7915:71-946(-)
MISSILSPRCNVLSCTAESTCSSWLAMASNFRAAITAATAAVPAAAAAAFPHPDVRARLILACSTSCSRQRVCARTKIWPAFSHSPNAHITCPKRANPIPHLGPASFSATCASTAALATCPWRRRHSVRLASSVGRHSRYRAPGARSSRSSAYVYSSSAPEKSATHANRLPMHRQILACSREERALILTASNARSSQVDPSGMSPPVSRFLAYIDMARSAKRSFSMYSSVLMSFVEHTPASSSSTAANATLFSALSVTVSRTPCGHVWRRSSCHRHSLMCCRPVAFHALFI